MRFLAFSLRLIYTRLMLKFFCSNCSIFYTIAHKMQKPLDTHIGGGIILTAHSSQLTAHSSQLTAHSVRAYSARTSFYSLIHNHIILTSSSHAYTVAAALCRLTFSESAAQTFRVRTSFKGACKNRSFIGWPYSKGVTDA